MRQRIGRLAGVIGLLFLISACASHAPIVECDKRLAPINVGDTTTVPSTHKSAPGGGKDKS